MTQIYRIVYKLKFKGSQEKEIPKDFDTEFAAKQILEQLKLESIFKNVSYSFIRSY